MITKDLGMVTAYAYAVSKGYTGTEEEFAELMASYASVAQEAVDAALAAAQSAQSAQDAQTAAEGARDTAQNTVDGAIAGIQAEGQTQIGAVQSEGATQVGNVNSAGQTQVGNVNAAGTTQVGNVNTAGSTQVGAVQAKGTEVLDSIPSDYTTLSGDVSGLKSAFEAVTEHKNLLPTGTAIIDDINNIIRKYNNGHVEVIGTAEGDGGRTRHLVEFTLPAGEYVLSVHSVVSTGETPGIYIQNASNTILVSQIEAPRSFTLANDTVCNIGINVVNTKVYNYACDLQIEAGTTATDYIPPTGTAVDDVARQLIPVVNELVSETADIENRVEALEEGRTDVSPVWNSGYYVNNSARALSPLNGFYYSDIIELKAGEGIKVIGAYTNTATVVDMLSKWNETGSTYVASIYPFPSVGYSDSPIYRATAIKEYIRVCFYNYQDTAINKIKVYKYTAEESAITNEVIELQALEIIPSIAMFEKVGFCGDSYVKGQLYGTSGVIGDFPNLAWGSDIGRTNGIDAEIYASSGADTNTFQSRSDCLPALLAEQNPCGLYVFCMGINDTTYVTLGSITDITSHSSYTEYPNTFYGNYGKIIEQILSYSPNSKIILMTPYHPSYNARYVTPLEEISEHYGIAMINTQDSKLCSSANFTSELVGGHPTSVLHSAMGRDIATLIGKCLAKNYDYFKDYHGV